MQQVHHSTSGSQWNGSATVIISYQPGYSRAKTSRLYHGISGALWCRPVQLDLQERTVMVPDLKLSTLPSSGDSGLDACRDGGEPPCKLIASGTSLCPPARHAATAYAVLRGMANGGTALLQCMQPPTVSTQQRLHSVHGYWQA